MTTLRMSLTDEVSLLTRVHTIRLGFLSGVREAGDEEELVTRIRVCLQAYRSRSLLRSRLQALRDIRAFCEIGSEYP